MAPRVFTSEAPLYCMQCNTPWVLQVPFDPRLVCEVERIECGSCKSVFTLWDGIARSLTVLPGFGPAGPLGSSSLHIVEHLVPGEMLRVDFAKDLPHGARVVSVTYTPQGEGGWPAEFYGNSPHRFQVPSHVVLASVQYAGEEHKTFPVGIHVLWLPAWSDDQSWSSMADAVEALQARKFTASIVPANVAVEYALQRALSQVVEAFTTIPRTKEFLGKAATYSHQLNVLLPMLSVWAGMPPLPGHIYSRLNKLRNLRNDIAHSGHLEQDVDPKELAELVLAALFGFRYVKWFADDFASRLIGLAPPKAPKTQQTAKAKPKPTKPTVESIDAAAYTVPCERCEALATQGLLSWSGDGSGIMTFCCDQCEAKEDASQHRFQKALTSLTALFRELGIRNPEKKSLQKEFIEAKGLVPWPRDS